MATTVPTDTAGMPVSHYTKADGSVEKVLGVSAPQVEVPDGLDVAKGSRADVAWAGTGNATIISLLKALYAARPLVLKEYFDETDDPEINPSGYTARGFSITNDDDTADLTFLVNGMTITVKAGETFEPTQFEAFSSVTIAATGAYRAWIFG